MRTDALGDTMWMRKFGGPGTDDGLSVEETEDLGLTVAGQSDSFGDGYNLYVFWTEANGDTLWTRDFGGVDHEKSGHVQELSEGFILAGYSGSFGGGYDFYLLRSGSTGSPIRGGFGRRSMISGAGSRTLRWTRG